jgi:hypothetical protein
MSIPYEEKAELYFEELDKAKINDSHQRKLFKYMERSANISPTKYIERKVKDTNKNIDELKKEWEIVKAFVKKDPSFFEEHMETFYMGHNIVGLIVNYSTKKFTEDKQAQNIIDEVFNIVKEENDKKFKEAKTTFDNFSDPKNAKDDKEDSAGDDVDEGLEERNRITEKDDQIFNY